MLARAAVETLAVVFAAVLVAPLVETAWLATAVSVVALVFALRFAWRLTLWTRNRLIVTDRRVFELRGLVVSRVASMPLAKVTDMTYKRSMLGRLLGYGELVVESSGQDQALNDLRHIPDPDEFYRTLTGLALGGYASDGHAPPPRGARAPR
jgi:uncharacterized membrane protein YdbT with pleckstrin-like domain